MDSGYSSWTCFSSAGEGMALLDCWVCSLGEIISRISTMPYHLYIQNEILSPLRMEHSFFLVPPAWRDEVCVTGSWEDKGLLITEFDPEEPPKAGNGMYSTLPDLLRFGQMLLSGGTLDGVTILSKRSVEMMTQNHLSGVRMQGWGNDEENYRFGLGFSLDDFDLCTPGTFNHEGYGHSGLYVDPVEQLVFAFLSSEYTRLHDRVCSRSESDRMVGVDRIASNRDDSRSFFSSRGAGPPGTAFSESCS